MIINSLNLVLALGSRDEIKDQIFMKRFGRRCGTSSVIYFRSIKNINLLYKKKYKKNVLGYLYINFILKLYGLISFFFFLYIYI